MAIVCDLCGSTNFVKQGDFFVCQGCGTQYSLEDAKKMMNADVPVKTDSGKENAVANYMTLGGNAYKLGNYAEAESYANKALEVDAMNAEAWLLRGKAAGWQSTLENMRIEEAKQYFMTAGNYADAEEKKDIALEAFREYCKMYQSWVLAMGKNGVIHDEKIWKEIRDAVYNYGGKINELGRSFNIEQPNHDIGFAAGIYNIIMDQWENWKSNYTGKDIGLYAFRAADVLEWSRNIKDTPETMKQLCESGVSLMDFVFAHWGWNGETAPDEHMLNYRKWFQEDLKYLDPDYQIKEPEVVNVFASGNKSSGGCYVATAVYGSYDCPSVWTLRRYRDNYLAESWYGRAFVRAYYAMSPTLVKWFGRTEWFRYFWKLILDKKVAELNSLGVANTPYHDREW